MVKLEKQVSVQSVSLVTISTTKIDGDEAYNFTIKIVLRQDLNAGEGDNG
jgi:type IV pilus assembly protein PilN